MVQIWQGEEEEEERGNSRTGEDITAGVYTHIVGGGGNRSLKS